MEQRRSEASVATFSTRWGAPAVGLGECGESGARQSALGRPKGRASVAIVVPGRVHSLKGLSECGDCGARQSALA